MQEIRDRPGGLFFIQKIKERVEKMEILIGAISTLVPAVLAFVIKGLLSDNKKLRESAKDEAIKRESSIQEGVLSLLRVQLIEYHEKYTDKGNIPNYAYENWTKMYKAYKGLGGNGMLGHMNEDIEELELKK